MRIESISKAEAAERQLIAATRLYFDDSDTVAIHTLVAASYNIIRDLSKHKRATKTMVKDHFVDSFTSGKKSKITAWINSFENFFKHADKDPDEMIEFNTEISEILLIDAWAQFEKIFGHLPVEGMAFRAWSGTPKPNIDSDTSSFIHEMRKLDRPAFFSFFLSFHQIHNQRLIEGIIHHRPNEKGSE